MKNDTIEKIKEDLNIKKAKIRELNNLNTLQEDLLLTNKQREEVEKEIKKLEKEIENFAIQTNKNISNITRKRIDRISVKSNDIKNLKVDYLVDHLIVAAEVTMIAGKPGGGKSLITVALSNMILKRTSIKEVYYFDFDNSATTLKDRNVHILLDKWKDEFFYLTPIKKDSGDIVTEEMIWKIIRTFQNSILEDILIIFDSAKNFLEKNADRDKNKDVSKIMSVFKRLRDNGATILFLHHTNKPQKDIDEVYAGSSAWLEDTSNAFILKTNKYKNTFIFSPEKNRTGFLQEQAFTYVAKEHRLKKEELLFAKEDECKESIRISIISYLKEISNPPSYTQIMLYLKNNGHRNNDKNNEVIQQWVNIFWSKTKIKEQNNKDIYKLIDKQDKSDKRDLK